MAPKTANKNFKDAAGFALINNFINWGYVDLSASEAWLYISLLTQVPGLNGEIPNDDSPYIPTSQRRLSNAIQMPYSTFRVYFSQLRERELVDVQLHNGKWKIKLSAPDPEEIQKAYQAKINLCRSKQNKCVKAIGYTAVPKSLIYGYPNVLPAAKFVYVLIKSLDWNSKGFVWHNFRKIAALAGLKYRTFKKYLRDLQDAQLICFSRRIGPQKATTAIHYNNAALIEQERARIFKSCVNPFDGVNFYRTFNRIAENIAFELIWGSIHPAKSAA